MFPILFSIGPLTITSYGLFVAMGFFITLIVTLKIGKRNGFGPEMVMDMGFYIIIAAIAGSRLMYIFINWRLYQENPLDIIKIWKGGLVFSGGIIGVLVTAAYYATRNKLSFWKMGDIWAPGAAVGQAIGRIGCLMAGCCYGQVTDLKWGIIFLHPQSLAPLSIPLHPTQIYSSFGCFTIFIVLLILFKKKKFDGQIFLWFLILHSVLRLIVERFRIDNRGIFLGSEMSITQIVTSIILIGSVTILILLKSKIKEPKGIT